MTESMTDSRGSRIRIGISACLLGQEVRFDCSGIMSKKAGGSQRTDRAQSCTELGHAGDPRTAASDGRTQDHVEAPTCRGLGVV